MQQTILDKLVIISERYQQISQLLAEPKIIADQNRYRELSKEYAQLAPIVHCFQRYEENAKEIAAAYEMLQQSEMRALAEEELQVLDERKVRLEGELRILLLPKDPNDQRNVFLEIRAGTGGDEAAIFAGDLFRMYARYVENNNWRLEILSSSEGEHGGFKEVITRIFGEGAYSRLKFESGVHRVQRVPDTEAQGRIHTSTCTVAVFPEVAEVEQIAINPQELKIDTYRSSGAGGQHVNVTDSAVRITHLPTGVVVECQDERSQHKNRLRAMALLQAKLLATEREKQRQEQAATRRNLVGTGDRSERIRTYNFPQGRLTDHRINLTLYRLDEVLAGSIDQIIEPLISEYQADLLAAEI